MGGFKLICGFGGCVVVGGWLLGLVRGGWEGESGLVGGGGGGEGGGGVWGRGL